MPVLNSTPVSAKTRGGSVPSKTNSGLPFLVVLGAITLLALYLQLHAITAKSFWLDEGASITIARLDWFNFIRILWRREMNMVLYYLVLRGWLHLGDSVAFIRGLSVIFAVAGVPAIFVLGQKLYGSGIGLISALLLSVNAFQVRYAQEARSYSLLVFLVVLSTYWLVTALESGQKHDWNWYIVTSALAIYAHFFAVLVLVAHWFALYSAEHLKINVDGIWERDAKHHLNRAAQLTALWTLPIWVFIATTGAGPIAWISRPKFGDIVGLLQKLSGNAQSPSLILYLVCVALGLFAVVRAVLNRTGDATTGIIVASWLFVPLVIVLGVSIGRPIFAPRYLIISLPAWILLASIGIAWLRPRFVAAIVFACLAWLGIGGVRSYYQTDFDIGRNDVRSATFYILNHAQPGDAVVFYSLSTRFPYDYYAAHSSATAKPEIVYPGNNSGLGWRDFMGVPSPVRIPAFANGHPRVWMVSTAPPTSDPTMSTFQSALERQYRLIDTQDFPYVHVALFGR